jgi:hypothetical protein
VWQNACKNGYAVYITGGQLGRGFIKTMIDGATAMRHQRMGHRWGRGLLHYLRSVCHAMVSSVTRNVQQGWRCGRMLAKMETLAA